MSDQSPSGSSYTKGRGKTGPVGSTTKRAGPSLTMTKTRNFDTGLSNKEFTGCGVAEYKGSAPSQPTDATVKQPSGHGMPKGGGSLGPKSFPPPKQSLTGVASTGAPSNGQGPKVKGRSTGGTIQKGHTGSTDKMPHGSKTSAGVRGKGFVNAGKKGM